MLAYADITLEPTYPSAPYEFAALAVTGLVLVVIVLVIVAGLVFRTEPPQA